MNFTTIMINERNEQYRKDRNLPPANGIRVDPVSQFEN